MIRFVKGNLFNSKAQTLVNTVNCVGIMGKGIALEFKNRYPEMYKDYRQQCDRGKIRPGVLTIYKSNHPWIINFPTKRHWKAQARLEDVEIGLQEFVHRYLEWGLTSVAMPALGCGYGGLDWEVVKPLIEKYLSPLNVDVEVYEPGSAISDAQKIQTDKLEAGMMRDMFGNLVKIPETKARSKHPKKSKR